MEASHPCGGLKEVISQPKRSSSRVKETPEGGGGEEGPP